MTASPIDDYLATLDADKRATLQQLRLDILAVAPGAEECISYKVPAFRLNGKLIAGFSAAKRHFSYLPHSGTVLASMPAEALEGYAWSKGALKFDIGAPLPRSLVQQLVEMRRLELKG